MEQIEKNFDEKTNLSLEGEPGTLESDNLKKSVKGIQ